MLCGQALIKLHLGIPKFQKIPNTLTGFSEKLYVQDIYSISIWFNGAALNKELEQADTEYIILEVSVE